MPVNEVSRSVATNSRTVANRGFKEGKPHYPSLEDTLEEDVDGVLEEDALKQIPILPLSFNAKVSTE